MAYYLSVDGVDDKLVTPSLTFTRVVIDFKPQQGASTHYYMDFRDASNSSPYVFRSASTDTWAGSFVSVDGVSKTSGTAAIPNNTRATVELTNAGGVAQTRTGLYFFSRFTSANYLAAYAYDIKIYNGAALVAWYDMTLGNQVVGTVQDQSGNGNHATLTGGTWGSDAPSGTVGSISYATKQSIFQTSSVALATKQVINRTGATAYATKQIITQTASVLAATKQSIYQVSSVSYATQQTITDGALPGSIAYSTKQIISQVSSTQVATKQAIYQNGSVLMASKQVIYRIGADPIATKQIVFNVGTVVIPVKLIIYANGSAAYATKQTIFDPQQQIIGIIQLNGDRTLYVYMAGSRNLDVILRGDI